MILNYKLGIASALSLLILGTLCGVDALAKRFKEGGEFLFSKITTIRGEIIETHDRISPTQLRGIVWKRNFAITLGGESAIRETWSNTRTDGGPGAGTEDSNRSGIRAALGVDTQTMGWHVSGENQLQRVLKDGDSLSMMTITIDPGNGCGVVRKWLKSVESTPDGGSVERYTPWRVLSAVCTAE